MKTNSLIFKISKVVGKENLSVTITLNDECKNGHQDFHIIGDIYQAGKPETDRYHVMSGCIHDEILKAFPEFKIFVTLHGCDYKGIPSHPMSNGFYHLTEGFHKSTPQDLNFKQMYCEYYRINDAQFDTLNKSENQIQFALTLERLDVFAKWEEEANRAIAYLEELTGNEFLVDSKRTQYYAPTEEQRAEESKRQASGYYTDEAKAEREKEVQNKVVINLQAERDKSIQKANDEYYAKLAVLKVGGSVALDNCIYYNHTQQISFNWRGYNKISEDLINKIKAEIILPEGVTIKNHS